MSKKAKKSFDSATLCAGISPDTIFENREDIIQGSKN
jgi:hypothetical protein